MKENNNFIANYALFTQRKQLFITLDLTTIHTYIEPISTFETTITQFL